MEKLEEDYLSSLNGEFGKNFISLECIDSTNSFAMRGSYPAGSVILTKNQTAGRGRSGRKWTQAEGGLTFSAVLPKFPAKLLTGLQIVCGFAVVDALVSYADVRLKWPNDIVCTGKKMGGLLIDALFEGNNPSKVVLGIGLNILKAPEEVYMCASLADFNKELPSIGKIFAAITNSLDVKLVEYLSGDLSIKSEWHAYSAYFGKFVAIHYKDEVVSVREIGITDEGFLEAERNGVVGIYNY